MKEKICACCLLPLPATKEYFYEVKAKSGKKYLRTYCKECAKDKQITYYDKNRPRLLDQKKEYRERKKHGN